VAYLVDVLALKLGDELLKAVAVGLDADRLKDGLDVGSRRRGVAAEAEEEVSCEVLHFDSAPTLVSVATFSSNPLMHNCQWKNSLVMGFEEQERSIRFNRTLGGERLF
jgi:hypothetical protein